MNRTKVIIAGASGMIGGRILNLCLDDMKINEVISLVRKPSGLNHSKLYEVLIEDFTSLDGIEKHFKNVQQAFFCIGVYTGQVSKDMLKKITVDMPAEFTRQLSKNSPQARLCFLSGAGSDRSEKSKTPFALFKGMAENKIEQSGLEWYSFRPGYIYPVQKRKEPNALYAIMRWMYPVLRLFGNNMSITSEQLAKSMFKIGQQGHSHSILENKDIIHALDL